MYYSNSQPEFELKLFLFLFIHKSAGFEDYGAYWRYNYETLDEDVPYKYTRKQLMEDVRSIYKEVHSASITMRMRSR